MRPPHRGQTRKVSGKRLTGGPVAEAAVESSEMIAPEVIEQSRVEQARGFGREVFFLVHEVFLQRAVETFVESVVSPKP